MSIEFRNVYAAPPAAVVAIDQAPATQDAIVRARTLTGLDRLRRAGDDPRGRGRIRRYRPSEGRFERHTYGPPAAGNASLGGVTPLSFTSG